MVRTAASTTAAKTDLRIIMGFNGEKPEKFPQLDSRVWVAAT
jgi:hypothetical protein